MKRIVIFGLSGDPVTSAHMEIIERLSKSFDKVLVIPTNVNYYKNYKGHDRAMFSFAERYDSLVDKCEKFSNVIVSDIERDIQEGWRFIHTLKKSMGIDETRTDYGRIANEIEELVDEQWYVAMGSDSLQNFKTWAEWENILKIAKLIVFNRPGYTTGFPEDVPYEYLEMNNNASSTKVRQNLISLMERFEDKIEEDDFDTWIDYLTWGKEYYEAEVGSTPDYKV